MNHMRFITNTSSSNWQIRAQREVEYKVRLTRALLNPANITLAAACGLDGKKCGKRLVVIDDEVYTLYKGQLDIYFSAWNLAPIWHIISGGESAKVIEPVLNVADAMIKAGLLRRTEAVIAIGGGVSLDIVGFAASLYRRGIPYIRIPTTLIGQIDAGIGIKTGINYGHHKNRLGSYFAPTEALIDPTFLCTLDERHISNGISEIIKMALIKDNRLFQLVEKNADILNAQALSSNNTEVEEILSRAIDGMLEELEPNLWEGNLERSVDYGHTFSPTLELCAEPELLHGEAVAIDIALSIVLELHRGLLTFEDSCRALDLMIRVGLPIKHLNFTLDLIEAALDDTIKHRDGLQRVPLTDGIGKVTFVNDLSKSELHVALAYINRYKRQRGMNVA